MEVQLVSYSLHHTSVSVRQADGEINWMCTGIYGWPDATNKIQTWRLLEALHRSITVPWMCIDDFNEVMWNTEKKGGRLKNNYSMEMFRDMVAHCRLHDMGFTGNPYTWSNGRQGDENVMERLDRALATNEWLEAFPYRHIHHLPRYKSDHAPILLECSASTKSNIEHNKSRRFRLEHMWLQHPDFEERLKNSWGDSIQGDNLMDTVTRCGEKLSNWAQIEFGSVRKKKKELYERLGELQNRLPNNENQREIQSKEAELDGILRKEEIMWAQRSRALWIKDGDKNKRFFHEKATHRKVRNTIQKLSSEDGKEVTKIEDIRKLVRDYDTANQNAETRTRTHVNRKDDSTQITN